MKAPTRAPLSVTGRDCWPRTLQLSVEEVFSLMLGCTLAIPRETPLEQGLDVTAMVGVAGPVCGVVTVRCSWNTGTRIASRMLGIEPERAGSQVQDAVGELCNMIAGNFKNKICELGNCLLSVPTVITGRDYRLHVAANQDFHAVLQFEGESVVVNFEVHD